MQGGIIARPSGSRNAQEEILKLRDHTDDNNTVNNDDHDNDNLNRNNGYLPNYNYLKV